MKEKGMRLVKSELSWTLGLVLKDRAARVGDDNPFLASVGQTPL